MGCARG
jgi:hypothetical protein